MRRAIARTAPLVLLVLAACSTRSGPPLAHLALTRPEGPIRSQHRRIEEEHGRGGWYFGNYNFRPAPDVHLYLEEAHEHAESEVLSEADVVLNVPFALDLLFFGFNHGTDEVTAGPGEDGDDEAMANAND